jgi:hypothetical protein
MALVPAKNPVDALMQPPVGAANRIRFYKRCAKHGCHSKFTVRFYEVNGHIQYQLGTCTGPGAPFYVITQLYPVYEKSSNIQASKTFMAWHGDTAYKFTVKLNKINNDLSAICKRWKLQKMRRYNLHVH